MPFLFMPTLPGTKQGRCVYVLSEDYLRSG